MLLLVVTIVFWSFAVVNLTRRDYPNAIGGFAIGALFAAIAVFLEWKRRRRIAAGLAKHSLLKGLDKLPLSQGDFKALLDWIGRPSPPRCSNTLMESADFLKTRGLPVEETLEWLRANGAGCDCEVILNIDAKFGADVGRKAEGPAS